MPTEHLGKVNHDYLVIKTEDNEFRKYVLGFLNLKCSIINSRLGGKNVCCLQNYSCLFSNSFVSGSGLGDSGMFTKW